VEFFEELIGREKKGEESKNMSAADTKKAASESSKFFQEALRSDACRI